MTDNFAAGVIEKLGFGYEKLRAVKPDIIQISMSGYGQTGPFRRYLGYYGRLVVDTSRGRVTHHVDGSSNPSWVGTRLVRYYALSADNA